MAFENPQLQADAKLGALLSAMMCFVCIGVGKMVDFSHEDVNDQVNNTRNPSLSLCSRLFLNALSYCL